MIVRVLYLLLAFIVLVNLCILTVGYLINVNIYKKYGKQLLLTFVAFVLLVTAMYTAFALIGLK